MKKKKSNSEAYINCFDCKKYTRINNEEGRCVFYGLVMPRNSGLCDDFKMADNNELIDIDSLKDTFFSKLYKFFCRKKK